MEPVGLIGIMRLSMHIISTNPRQFACIALLLGIPYAFNLLVLDVSNLALESLLIYHITFFRLLSSTDHQILLSAQAPAAAIPPSTSNSSTSLPLTDPLLPPLDLSHFNPASLLSSLLFSILLPFISTPLLTFTACQACLNKPLNLKSSLLSIPQCAKNFVLASLCIAAVLFVCFCCMMMALGIPIAVVVLTNGNMAVSVLALGMLMTVGLSTVYVAIVFSLTHTVAILEKRKGWEAMKRSMDLLNGRKWVALGLACVVYAMSTPCDYSVLWQWKGATILKVSMQTVSALCSMTSRVVLYMSCKRRLEEPLHMLMAGTQLNHQSLPMSMDIETHSLLTPL